MSHMPLAHSLTHSLTHCTTRQLPEALARLDAHTKSLRATAGLLIREYAKETVAAACPLCVGDSLKRLVEKIAPPTQLSRGASSNSVAR
jgi:hypothetical protein